MEFAELRDYYPGDDLRRLDWKAYGRSDKFFLKEYESETNARIYFLLDTSGSMQFTGEAGVSRLLFSQQLIATLSSLFLYQSDAVGVARTREGDMMTPLHRGESSLPLILEGLAEIEAGGETKLCAQMHEVAELIPRRSLVLVLSDFLTPLPELEKALQHLAHFSHEVTFIQALSQDEIDLPDSPRTAYKDLESGEIIKTKPSAIRGDYQEKLQAHLKEVEKIATRNRAEHFLVTIEDGVERAVQSFLQSHIDHV